MSITPSPSEHSAPAPPAGEEIHLPGPTILPLVTAIAITMIVIGTTLGWWISIVGLVILVIALVRWIRDTRRDIAALPEQHS
jgi:Flp pilus assembly protein TadB